MENKYQHVFDLQGKKMHRTKIHLKDFDDINKIEGLENDESLITNFELINKKYPTRNILINFNLSLLRFEVSADFHLSHTFRRILTAESYFPTIFF